MILVNAVEVHYSFQMKIKFLWVTLLSFLQIARVYGADIALDEARSVQQESQLAFSRILIGEFKNAKTQKVLGSEFCNDLANEFNNKSYWDSRCGLGAQANQTKAINGSDAVLSGEWVDGELNLTLSSKNLKYVLGSWRLKIAPPEDSVVQPTAEQIASSLISLVPMIGHILKVSANGKAIINMGSKKGMRVGQNFMVFDYNSVRLPLNGKQTELARLQILSVEPDTSVVNVDYLTREEDLLTAGAKIKIDDSGIVKSIIFQRETAKAWASIGGQLMKIQVSTDPMSTQQKRNYNFNYTSFFDLAVGVKQYYAHALFGSAAGPTADISYLEVEAGTDVFKGDFQDGFVLMGAGLNFSQYLADNHISPGNYENSQRISPYLDVRIQYEPRPRFLFYVGAKVLYPTFTSGQLGGTELFSYGAEPYVGTRIQFTSSIAAEVLARSRYYSINFSGASGVRETQTAFLLKGVYLIN